MEKQIRIGISGVPSTGKSTLAKQLSSFLGLPLVREYAREHIEKYNTTDFKDQYQILEEQIYREMQHDSFVTDSPIPLCAFYACESYTGQDPGSMGIIWTRIFKHLTTNNYSCIFHLPPRIEPEYDGIRSTRQFLPVWREQADVSIQTFFKTIWKPQAFHVIESIDERVQECILHLNN